MDDRVRQALPRTAHFLDVVDAVVASVPARTAARDGAGEASFAEVDGMARQLAGQLQAAGVRRGDIVAIAREHSIGTLVAILAVFRCGAAYLPLDLALPAQRLRRMLEKACCRVILGGNADIAAEVTEGLLAIDVEAAMAAGRSTWQPVAVEASDLAYVIFTSGSTGEPKGAMLSHANMVNHLWSKVDALQLVADDTVAASASPGFDLSVWQYLVAWLCGAATTMVSRTIVKDPLALFETLQRHGVTVFEAVPSHLGLLLDVAASRGSRLCPTLRVMVSAGEVLPAALARRWFAHETATLVNAYGPTECGVDVTHYVMHEAPSASEVPIGSAIDGSQLLVVDGAFRRVADGDAGELLIGGAATGLGYIHDADRTAAAFVSLPGIDGRFYRTGDRVRQRAGVFEFMGRIDLQLKLRGFRIEPEEVEAALHRHLDVRRVAVVLQGEGAHAELVAVIQATTPGHATPALRSALHDLARDALPDYMCPARIEFIHTLPVTSRDKIDREAVGRFLSLLNPSR